MTTSGAGPHGRYDVVVVGGGIVGVATAREYLKRHPDLRLLLLEKENELARHQTGHNSGVIHSGIYYAPGSLKAELCRLGARQTKEFADEKGIPYRECGKLLVATSPIEGERLAALALRAEENRIEVDSVSRDELKSLEPEVSGLGALLVRETAIIDYGLVTHRLADEVRGAGGEIRLGARVVGAHEGEDGVELRLAGGEIVTAGRAVFCGGLQADRLARMAGVRSDVQIVPFRGEYFTVQPGRGDLVRHLIYPVPDPELPFLGVHLSPTIHGELTVGPNAVLGLAREKYPKYSVNLRDLLQMARFGGLWRVATANARTGLHEMYNSVFARGYLREVRRYAPSLELKDLRPREAGIRAQAVDARGTLLHDFRLEKTERMLHVLNAPSPAATSAMPIAARIVDALGAEVPAG